MNERRPFLPTKSLFDPRVFVTVTLAVVQLSLLCAIGLAGDGFLALGLPALERYGALARTLVWDEGQYWRLVSAMFLHAGLPHLFLNVVCLLYFGSRVEIALGRWRYLMVFLAAGLAGNLASLLGSGALVSVGSSGAIFGVVIIYLMIQLGGPSHWSVVMRQRASRWLFLLAGMMLAFGFLVPQIDSMAHLGGAVTGAVFGYFFLAARRDAEGTQSKRGLALAAWLVLFVLMILAVRRPPDDAAHHVRLGYYYVTRSPSTPPLADVAKAERHFLAATARDTGRALATLDRLVRSTLVARRYRAHLTLFLLGMFSLDEPVFDHYERRVADEPSGDGYWLLAQLARQFGIADRKAALEACANGQSEYPTAHHWGLTEAEVQVAFRQFDEALAILEDRLEGTTVSETADWWELVARGRAGRHEWAAAAKATSRCLTATWIDALDAPTEMRDLIVKDLRLRALRELGIDRAAAALRDELESAWRRRALRDEDRASGANELAWFLATHNGNLDEAARLARESVELAATSMNLDTLAWVEYKRGDYPAAWDAMERALAINPNAPDYFYRAGAILFALDRNEEAREHLRRAVEPGLDFEDFEQAQRLLRQLTAESDDNQSPTTASERSADPP